MTDGPRDDRPDDVTLPRGLLHHLVDAGDAANPAVPLKEAFIERIGPSYYGHLEEPVTIDGETALHLTLPAEYHRLNEALERYLGDFNRAVLANRRL